jgi:hypothetical protein
LPKAQDGVAHYFEKVPFHIPRIDYRLPLLERGVAGWHKVHEKVESTGNVRRKPPRRH